MGKKKEGAALNKDKRSKALEKYSFLFGEESFGGHLAAEKKAIQEAVRGWKRGNADGGFALIAEGIEGLISQYNSWWSGKVYGKEIRQLKSVLLKLGQKKKARDEGVGEQSVALIYG